MEATTESDPTAKAHAAAVLEAWHEDLVGRWGEPQHAPEPVDASSIRRFAQAIMDPDPIYWDDRQAELSRFGNIVAPPLYPLHAIRRAGGTPDPLNTAFDNPDFDGVGELLTAYGLPALNLPLKRLLNGGNDVVVESLARIGDRISAISCYEQIYEKRGRSGPLVFVVVLTHYTACRSVDDRPRPLLRSRQTFIWR